MVTFEKLKGTGCKILLVKISPETNKKTESKLEKEIHQILEDKTFGNDFNSLAKSQILRRTLGEWTVNMEKSQQIEFVAGVYWDEEHQQHSIVSVFDVRNKEPNNCRYSKKLEGNNLNFATWFDRGTPRNSNPFDKPDYSVNLTKQLQSLKNGFLKFDKTMGGKFKNLLSQPIYGAEDFKKSHNPVKYINVN